MTHRVLVVDDTAFMRFTIKQILDKEGVFEVVGEAENGAVAVDKYKELNPELVLLDITMPPVDGVVDGIDALKRIMAINPEAKVVMCSAMGQQAMVVEALKSGAKDFVVKPFKGPRVLEALYNALK